MHFHWQNLREGERGVLLHGRAWLHAGRTKWSCSWRIGFGSGTRAEVDVGGDESDFRAALALGLFALYLGGEGLLPYRALARGWPRTTGVSLYKDHLMLRLHCDDSSVTYYTDAKGRRRNKPEHGWYRSWFLKDVLLGRPVHESRPLAEPANYAVQMPEGRYSATVQMTEDTWKRPRWPWPKRIVRARIDVPQGIPKPGKGENAWDCGEDATYSMTCPAATADEGIRRLVESVARDRLRYGGAGWLPEEAASLGRERP